MVALLSLFDLLEIAVEFFLLGEGGAVNARQHRIFGIAAPVGAGHLHELESISDFSDRRHVRAAAKIEPVALFVDFDLLVGRNGIDELDLEGLTHVAESLLRLLARPGFLCERFVARDDLAHLLFDDRQIFQRERLVASKVVIKSVFDDRPDGDLCAGPKILHRFSEHVGGVMPDQLERARVFA